MLRPPAQLMAWSSHPPFILALVMMTAGSFGAGCSRETSVPDLKENPPTAADSPISGTLQGTITELSSVPDPKTSPYAHAASTALLTLADGQEVIVSCPAFENRILTPFGHVHVGDRVRFQAKPETEVPGSTRKRYQLRDTLNRFDITERYWASEAHIVGRALEVDSRGSDSDELKRQIAYESRWIQTALRETPSPLFGGVTNEFFFQGKRTHYKPKFWATPPDKASHAGVRSALLQFHQRLSDRGIELYVVLPPTSSSLYPDLALNTYFDPELHTPPNQTIRNLLADLASQGVRTIDLMPSFLDQRWFEYEGETYPLYRPNDTHWSSFGARLAAREIADQIREGTSHQDQLDGFPEDTLVEEVEVIEMDSDIAEMFQDGRQHWRITVEPHASPAYRVLARGKGEDRHGETLAALVRHAHPEAAIHLIGDSFAHELFTEHAGLHAHLTKELRSPINLYFDYGCGGTICGRWLATEQPDFAKVVILVINERYTSHDELWLDLPEEGSLPKRGARSRGI